MSELLSTENRALVEPEMLKPPRTSWGDGGYFSWATVNRLLDAAREEGRQLGRDSRPLPEPFIG